MQIITSFFSKLDSFPVLKQEKVWLFSPDQFQTHSKKHGRRSQVFFRDNKIRTENCRIVQHLFWLSERQQRKILAYSQQLQSNSGSFSVVEQQQQELLLISQFAIQFVLYRMFKYVLNQELVLTPCIKAEFEDFSVTMLHPVTTFPKGRIMN